MSARSVLAGVAVLLAALLAVQALRGAKSEASSFSPPRRPVRLPAVLEGLPLRDVAFPPGTLGVHGWYIPAKNQAAVILAHGSGADRSQLATEARRLADAGFGVLAFDWPGHGESSGHVTYGAEERDALRAAVTFVASRAEVASDRVGALGFSVGAALVAVTAPDEPRLRAIALVSCFADSEVQTGRQFGRWGFVMKWPAIWVDRWFMPAGPLRPVESVRHLGGTDLLVVASTEDGVVPAWMSEEVYRAASGGGGSRGSREWLLVPHSGHGGLDAVAPGPYGDALVRFFRRSLEAADANAAPPVRP